MNQLDELYRECRLCPRECGVDRIAGETGFCRESNFMRLAWAGLHRGEEPPVTGETGSGTLFFTGCTLGCVFCQNRQLSHSEAGREVGPDELAEIMLSLESSGADNINLVTGTHFIPGILESLDSARNKGLSLPVVWNSSGYERPEVLDLLAPGIDLWLPDVKTLDSALSHKLFNAADYPGYAIGAVNYMISTPAAGIQWEGISLKLILRHLILPGFIESSRRVLDWYSRIMVPEIPVSVMTQYIPVPGAGPAAPDRILTEKEVFEVYKIMDDFSIESGFFQGPPEELSSSWRPDFNRENPFPDGGGRKTWFWKDS